MSMPSSRELVATTQRRVPPLSASSMRGALFLGHGAVVCAGERRHLGDVADACRVVFGVDSLLREDAAQVNIVERRGELFR